MCPVSTNCIASQLVKNGAHKTSDCEPTRLVNKQLSDLWKIPTPELHSTSEPFRPEEFAAALRRLKPGKYPGLDSIFKEFILHARSALKSSFYGFLNFCMRQLKIPKIWRRALLCTEDDNSCYRNVCKMSVASFALAVVFIIRLFSTSAFRVPEH